MSKKPLALGEPIWKRFTGGPNLAAAKPNGNPADPRGDGEADSLASAESGHRKNRKGKNRLALRRSRKPVTGSTITPNKKTEAGPRGDGSSEEAGSQVSGGAGGNAADNNTIVPNKNLSLLASPEDTKFDPNFFSNDDKNSSSSNNNANLNSNSSPDSKSKSLTQVAESDSLLDRDFFSKQPKESLTERRRKPPRVSLAVTEKSVPETRKEIIDQKENRVRALRTQVSFE